MYRVVKDFTDRIDKHIYRVGDVYPRAGVAVSDERVAELTSRENMRGEVLIEAVDVPQKAKIQPVRAENGSKDKSVAKAGNKPKKRKKKE